MIAITTRTTLGPPASPTPRPRKTRLPVMNAVKTLPSATKLIASIAPDERVSPINRRSRTVVSACAVAISLADDDRLVPGESRERLVVQVQMGGNQLGRREGHPLVERQVGEAVAAEQLEEAQRLVAGVLHVVAHGEGDVADVAGLEVERPGLLVGGEHGHAAAPRDVVLPLVRVGA